MKDVPAIKSVMTPFPHWVEAGATVDAARRLMREHDIRHLPVMEQGELVGLLADRDIRKALVGRSAAGVPSVGAICERPAFTVELSAPLDGVLCEMAKGHLESVIVVKQGRLAGIFTTVDACRAFAQLLGQLFPRGDKNDAA